MYIVRYKYSEDVTKALRVYLILNYAALSIASTGLRHIFHFHAQTIIFKAISFMEYKNQMTPESCLSSNKKI